MPTTPAPTILLVEDDAGHAILIRQNLESAGVVSKIEHFSDGQTILDFFFGGQYQHSETYVILLDIRMPKVDGIEVLRRLKADREFRKLPIIMLTTTDNLHEVERCHQLGCSLYIQKPVDYDRFAEAIRRIGLCVPLALVPPLTGRD